MKLKGKTVLVMGLGESGKSAVNFLKSQGAIVYAYDDRKILESGAICVKKFNNIPFEKLSFAVISPGISVYDKKIIYLKNIGVKIKSELELGASFIRGKIIGITGTNGKTTCVNLLKHVLGDKAILCGNVGIPITKIIKNSKRKNIYICEISSFQMETTNNLNLFTGAILNILPDHLDRHKTFLEYFSLKEKMLGFCKNKVINIDDENVDKLSKKYSINAVSKTKKTNCVYIENGIIMYKNREIMFANEVPLLGEKNLENVLCCVAILCKLKINPSQIREKILSFKPLEHRMEIVGNVNGVEYVNDSKSTNIASTICALNAFENQSIILLLGGKDKGLDFSPIFDFKLKAVVCFGECGSKISKFSPAQTFVEQNLFSAFQRAVKLASQGDVVLLSPACSSFDEFSGFEERGRTFKNYVSKLITGEK